MTPAPLLSPGLKERPRACLAPGCGLQPCLPSRLLGGAPGALLLRDYWRRGVEKAVSRRPRRAGFVAASLRRAQPGGGRGSRGSAQSPGRSHCFPPRSSGGSRGLRLGPRVRPKRQCTGPQLQAPSIADAHHISPEPQPRIANSAQFRAAACRLGSRPAAPDVGQGNQGSETRGEPDPLDVPSVMGRGTRRSGLWCHSCTSVLVQAGV